MKYSKQIVDFLATCFPEIESKVIDLNLKENGLESTIETLLSIDQEADEYDSFEDQSKMNFENTYMIQTTWASIPILIPRSIAIVKEPLNDPSITDWKTRFSEIHLYTSQKISIKSKHKNDKHDLLPLLIYILEYHDKGYEYVVGDQSHNDFMHQLVNDGSDLRYCAREWRDRAYNLAKNRILLLQKASVAYRDHGGEVAAYYSEEARKLLKDINECHTRASQYQLLHLHPSGIYDQVDFHGLRVIDVTRLFWPMLSAWMNVKNSFNLTIVTGSGIHSKGSIGKIRSALISMLQHQKDEFTWKALPGSIILTRIEPRK